jgi:hypothetical protein
MSKITLEKALEKFKDGDINFDEYVGLTASIYDKWMSYFTNRYRNHIYYLCAEDLKQEAYLETWRRVDMWDFKKSPLIDYVKFNVGRRIIIIIEKSLGYPSRKQKVDIYKQVDCSYEFDNFSYDCVDSLDNLVFFNSIYDKLNDFHKIILVNYLKDRTFLETCDLIYQDIDMRIKYKISSKIGLYRKIRREFGKLRV